MPNSIVKDEQQQFHDFYYACAGYSVYLDQKSGKESSGDKQTPAKLPVCVGLEVRSLALSHTRTEQNIFTCYMGWEHGINLLHNCIELCSSASFHKIVYWIDLLVSVV